MSELGDQDKLARRKKRLQGLLSKPLMMAEGGEVEEPPMESGEDDFLSMDDASSEVEPDELAKRKARLANLMKPNFAKKK